MQRFNADYSHEDKIEALKMLGSPSAGQINCLYFSARNLAIESLLLRLVAKLAHVSPSNIMADWRESSNAAPRIEISLKNADGELLATFVLPVEREIVVGTSLPSPCMYRAGETCRYIPRPGRKSAVMRRFEDEAMKLWVLGALTEMVSAVNYPFEYTSFSGY